MLIKNHPTFPRAIFRSLLQKAVRRGYTDLVETVARQLAEHGDSKWLNIRAGIIALEECWTLTSKIETHTIDLLKATSRCKKNKDAAGLGSLGYAYSIGEYPHLSYSVEDRPIRIVAAGLKRPIDFFKWIRLQDLNSNQIAVVNMSEISFKRSSWPWDKAFAIAASYLACNSLPPTEISPAPILTKFPYWVAIDKHTPEGKKILAITAKKLNMSYLNLSWISFYLESSLSNSETDSQWWKKERSWRFKHLKIEEDEAIAIWTAAKKIIKDTSLEHVILLDNLLTNAHHIKQPSNKLF